LLVLLTCMQVLAADSTTVTLLSGKPKKSTTAAVFMSMAVPGLGQFYTHEYIKAAGAVIAEGALAASMSFNNDRMMAARRSAVNWTASLPDSLSYQKNPYSGIQHFYQNQRNRLIWWLAGTVLLSMGDAYVDAHLYGVDFSPSLTFDGGTVGLSVACKF
jgi:hypothetical protein